MAVEGPIVPRSSRPLVKLLERQRPALRNRRHGFRERGVAEVRTTPERPPFPRRAQSARLVGTGLRRNPRARRDPRLEELPRLQRRDQETLPVLREPTAPP